MGKRGRHKYNTDDEFPVLGGLGLYAGNINGDGNCLFRALSDQLYGDQERYATIRSEVMAYILANKERFEPFTGVYDETFDNYTRRMAEDGTYGGHLEIVAFSEVHKAQVIIYQGEIMYAVNPTESDPEIKIHIAYHIWEHYSSVRNKDGPHTGVPEVDPKPCEVERVQTSSNEKPQWQVDLVLRSVPGVSEETVRARLQKANYDQVIEDLLVEPDTEDQADDTAIEQNDTPIAPPSSEQEKEEPQKARAKLKKKDKKKKDFQEKWAKKKEKAAAKKSASAAQPKSNREQSEDPIFI